MGLTDRRSILKAIGLATGAVLMNGKKTMAQESSAGGALARITAPLSDQRLALPDFPALEFRTALPEGLDWFESPAPVTDFDASGMFSAFDRYWLGYAPDRRDRLEISIYCARIIPERVALASDYGRLLAQVWGPKNYGLSGAERDFGEVLTGEDTSGYDRRTRLSIWRRGTDLLILRADTTLEDIETEAPRLAAMVGSLEFVNALDDPITGNLVAHQLRLPSGQTFDYGLPGHWQAFDTSKAAAAPVSAAVWLDRADEGGNNALGVFGVAIPRGAKAADAPLREIATAMSDLLMENLAPAAEFARKPMSEDRLGGFAPDSVQSLYLDRLDWSDGRKMGASSFFVAGPEDVVGYSALSAYPTDQEAMGIFMHGNFVGRLVLDDLRQQFGTSRQ